MYLLCQDICLWYFVSDLLSSRSSSLRLRRVLQISHNSVVSALCTKENKKYDPFISYLSYHCIEQNTMSSNSFCKQRLHGDLFFSCQDGKCFIFVCESVSTSVPVFTVGHVFKPV